MRRRLVIALLALGTVAGYAAGFASLHHHWAHRHHWQHDCQGAEPREPDPR